VKQNGLIWLAYAGLTILVTWPLAGRLGTHIPGSEGDSWVHQWTFHWVKNQLANGREIYFTDLMYHPQGISLVQHNFAWFHIAVWLPLQAIVGEATAYTLIFLFGFSLTAFTTYLLAKELVKQTPAAFAAGLVTGFWPYTLSHHNHPNLIFIGFVPLALLYTKRVSEAPTWRNGLGLMLSVTLTGLVRWQLLALCLALLVVYWLYQAYAAWSQQQITAVIITTAIALTAATAVMLPLAWPLISNQMNADVTAESLSANESRIGETDLLAYITPSRYHPMWGEFAFELTENFIVNKIFTPYIGVATLLLIFFALRYRWKETWIWLTIALIYMTLALGANLTINGRDLFTLPYVFLENTFFGALIRRPDRFNVILSIPIGILAAYGMTEIVYLPHFHARRDFIWIFLGAMIVFESLTIYPTYELYTPSWYGDLEKGAYAILDLPRHQRVYDEQYMYYQFTHEKPMVGGHVSRPPADAFAFIHQVPLLQNDGSNLDMITEIDDVGRQLQLLADENIRYLVLHKQFLSEEQQVGWLDWLAIEPTHQDRDLIVFDTSTRPTITQYLTPELGIVEITASPLETAQAGWIDISVIWGTASSPTADYEACFILQNEAGETVQTVCHPFAPKRATSSWQAGEWVHGRYPLNVDPYLAESGNYTLAVYANDGESVVGETAMILPLTLTAQNRTFTPPTTQNRTQIAWAPPIELVGYDLNGTELTLHWHVTERIPDTYAVFRHLIDPQTGELIGQVDGAPRNWAYPTNWWEANEYVSETVSLPLDLVNTPVELVIGLYDPISGERLPISQASEIRADGTAVLLTTIEP